MLRSFRAGAGRGEKRSDAQRMVASGCGTMSDQAPVRL